jgi:polyisoprenoid-binding protein YceI
MSSIVENRSINGIELPPVGRYAFDKSHTTVGFVARHMLSKVRGRFTAYAGEVTVGESIEDSSVTLEIAASSVNTDSEQRDGHLRSDDFLDVETYPNLSFASTGLRVGEGSSFELDGRLTIKDVTNPVTLQGEFLGSGPGMQGGTIASGRTRRSSARLGPDLERRGETGGFWSAEGGHRAGRGASPAGELRIKDGGPGGGAQARRPRYAWPCEPRSSN